MTCPNKGCGEIQPPYLDKDTDKVYCSKCNKEIENITIFAKNQLKMLKQFKKKEKKSFAVKCNQCNAEERPKLVNNEVICGACNKKLDQLSGPFLLMLKDKLKKVDQDI